MTEKAEIKMFRQMKGGSKPKSRGLYPRGFNF